VHSTMKSDGPVLTRRAAFGLGGLGVRLVAVLAVAMMADCGGGGGGSGGGPSPVPTVPLVTPTPGPAATPTPTSASASLHIILSEGDTIQGGLTVADIEDADLADDGSVAAIVEIAGARGARGAVRRTRGGGGFATVFSPETDPSLSTTTLQNVRIASGGTMLLTSEIGLDGDRLYRIAADGSVGELAGVPPGVVAPDFRVLGEIEIGRNGDIGFVGGGSPCTVTQQGDSERVRCIVHVYTTDGSSVSEVELPDIDLSDQNPSTPQVRITDEGAVYFSVPGGGREPTIVRREDGGTVTVLSADDEVDPVGRLNRPQLNAINEAGDLLVTTTLQADPGPSRPGVVGILRGGDFIEIAREDLDTGPDDVTDLRTVGLDDFGQVVFTARFGLPDSPEGIRRSLRLFDGSAVTEVAAEGMTFPGTDLTILSIGSIRFNRNGDVAFVAELGMRTPGTVTIIESRAVRRSAGSAVLETVLTTRGAGPVGTLSALEVVGLASDGSLLIVAQAEPAGDRLLITADPPRSP
jgi:hypothetical protein